MPIAHVIVIIFVIVVVVDDVTLKKARDFSVRLVRFFASFFMNRIYTISLLLLVAPSF